MLGVEHGKLDLSRRGGFTYTPDANYFGVDYFKYRACEAGHMRICSKPAVVKITVRNLAPTANDDSYKARKNHTKRIPAPGVLENDSDPEGDQMRVSEYTQPRRGGVTVKTYGGFTFRPDKNFTGRTSFAYRLTDGHGHYDTATVAMRVRP